MFNMKSVGKNEDKKVTETVIKGRDEEIEVTPELIEEMERVKKEPIIPVKGNLRKHFED